MKQNSHNRKSVSPRSTRKAIAPAGDKLGMMEWFRIGEHDRIDQVLDDLKSWGSAIFAPAFHGQMPVRPRVKRSTPGCSRNSPGR